MGVVVCLLWCGGGVCVVCLVVCGVCAFGGFVCVCFPLWCVCFGVCGGDWFALGGVGGVVVCSIATHSPPH